MTKQQKLKWGAVLITFLFLSGIGGLAGAAIAAGIGSVRFEVTTVLFYMFNALAFMPIHQEMPKGFGRDAAFLSMSIIPLFLSLIPVLTPFFFAFNLVVAIGFLLINAHLAYKEECRKLTSAAAAVNDPPLAAGPNAPINEAAQPLLAPVPAAAVIAPIPVAQGAPINEAAQPLAAAARNTEKVADRKYNVGSFVDSPLVIPLVSAGAGARPIPAPNPLAQPLLHDRADYKQSSFS